MTEPSLEIRLLEAILFASAEPVKEAALARRLPEGTDIPALIAELQANYTDRGVNLSRIGGKWAFRTALDLASHLESERIVTRKLSRAAVETMAIIAYHQPVTRAEIEEIRGVVISRGTLDILLEAGWIRPRGRRRTPGRPMTWGTTDSFLDQFGLESIGDLPGIDELKAAGLLSSGIDLATVRQHVSEGSGLEEGDQPDEDEDLDEIARPIDLGED